MNVVRFERRAHQRRRTLLSGLVVFGGGWKSMDCQIRGWSDGGALLRFDGPTILPTMFELRLKERGDRRPARFVWARNGDVGVAFE